MKTRNLVALSTFGRPALVEFAQRRGGHEAIEAARTICRTPESLVALAALDDVLHRAGALGYASRVTVDFALLRDLDYYTGFLFEGYVEEIGFSLCGGGRYDSLLPRFGFDVPAVARKVYDVSGAGDTVVAVLTLALAAEIPAEVATQLANFAAGAVVEKLGTATAQPREIVEVMERPPIDARPGG